MSCLSDKFPFLSNIYYCRYTQMEKVFVLETTVGTTAITVPFRSIRHVTRHRPHCCVENRSVSQVTEASVGQVQRVTGTTAASTAAFRHQISKSGIRRWLLDVLLIHSRQPARHLKIGPRSQKVGLVSITKVFLGGFTSSNSPA